MKTVVMDWTLSLKETTCYLEVGGDGRIALRRVYGNYMGGWEVDGTGSGGIVSCGATRGTVTQVSIQFNAHRIKCKTQEEDAE
jgi:hypothetical protein